MGFYFYEVWGLSDGSLIGGKHFPLAVGCFFGMMGFFIPTVGGLGEAFGGGFIHDRVAK
jgi:hypothetical protein